MINWPQNGQIPEINKWPYTFTYLYLISISSLPASWNIVGITTSVVWGTFPLYRLTVRTWVQRRKNPESSTITFLIWVLIKGFKLCQDMELIWNDYLWMRVQNSGYKTVATSSITNKQHECFNAIVQRIMLQLLFPLIKKKTSKLKDRNKYLTNKMTESYIWDANNWGIRRKM